MKVVLVMGVFWGIGVEIVKCFVLEGFYMVVNYVNSVGVVDKVVEEIKVVGG